LSTTFFTISLSSTERCLMNSLATFVEVAAVHMKTLVAMSESKACSKVNICAQELHGGGGWTHCH